MSWIRVVYLYLFALVGLVLIVIGGAQLIDLGLRTYVLTEADAEMRVQSVPEPPLRLSPSTAEALATDSTLDADTRRALDQWADDYQRMRERREAVDPVRARRQRQLATALSLLLVGLPLFGYHWAVIRRERAGF